MSLPKNYDWKVTVPEGSSGIWAVERFTVSEKESSLDAVLAISHGHARFVPPGAYTRLTRGLFHTVVMSDTPDETRDHRWFVHHAEGRVLLAGLGLGMVLKALLHKPEVQHVDVIEESADVIKLVWDHYARQHGARVSLIHADVLTWQPAKETRWDHAWWDIWDGICSDNLKDMAVLNRRFARRIPNRGAWCRAQCELQRDRNRDAPWNR